MTQGNTDSLDSGKNPVLGGYLKKNPAPNTEPPPGYQSPFITAALVRRVRQPADKPAGSFPVPIPNVRLYISTGGCLILRVGRKEPADL